uniref:hypothetical protein n=1 Tax=Roseivirga sp. TaxID=1964215 RepID=UPI0040484D93
MEKKETKYLTKEILLRKSKQAITKAADDAMEMVGYVIKAESGWVVKEYQDGRKERIKAIETVVRPNDIILD